MALPVLNAPTHELTLTSTGETIKFRPFLVKEEKILLMALESNDEQEMMGLVETFINKVFEDAEETQTGPVPPVEDEIDIYVRNPLIVQDEKEREAAQEVISKTPQAVIDSINT